MRLAAPNPTDPRPPNGSGAPAPKACPPIPRAHMQANFLARRYRLAPHLAALVASLAYAEAAR